MGNRGTSSRELGAAILGACGIPMDQVISVSLELHACAAATLAVTSYVPGDAGQPLAEALRRYRLVEIERRPSGSACPTCGGESIDVSSLGDQDVQLVCSTPGCSQATWTVACTVETDAEFRWDADGAAHARSVATPAAAVTGNAINHLPGNTP